MGLESVVEEFLSALKADDTKRLYGRGLGLFQQYLSETSKMSIKDFLSEVEADLSKPRMQKTRIARKTLNGFVEWLEKQSYAPKTVNAYAEAVQALARYYDLPISLKYVKHPPSIAVHKKHAWTIEEIGKFVDLLESLQYKCIASIITQSGLSISDVLGLKYGDIREEFEKGMTPLCLDLSRKKTNVQFMTFIGEWAIDFLRQHLKGQRLKDAQPLFTVASRTVDHYFRLTGKKFGKFKGRNPYSPHSLRAAFNTILRDHQVDPLYVEFWMGHRLPEQQIVYVSKSREGWRETYRTLAEPWLTPRNVQNALGGN